MEQNYKNDHITDVTNENIVAAADEPEAPVTQTVNEQNADAVNPHPAGQQFDPAPTYTQQPYPNPYQQPYSQPQQPYPNPYQQPYSQPQQPYLQPYQQPYPYSQQPYQQVYYQQPVQPPYATAPAIPSPKSMLSPQEIKKWQTMGIISLVLSVVGILSSIVFLRITQHTAQFNSQPAVILFFMIVLPISSIVTGLILGLISRSKLKQNNICGLIGWIIALVGIGGAVFFILGTFTVFGLFYLIFSGAGHH